MQTYRYSLQPYDGADTRHYCPYCNHRTKTFTRYIDTRTGNDIHYTVGKCSRFDNCAYHLSPSAYFKVNPLPKAAYNKPKFTRSAVSLANSSTSFIPPQVFKQSLKQYYNNNFISYLIAQFGRCMANKLIARYYIGTANHWPGATVFWQLDANGRVRTGKIMLYNSQTGKRVKQPFNHITWAHKLVGSRQRAVGSNKRFVVGGERLSGNWDGTTANCQPGTANFQLKQCLFGVHLLNADMHKTVALVESEKTAIIASVFMPQYLWMATGGLCNLNAAVCLPLKGRRVMLFPDLNASAQWQHKANVINKYIIDIDFIMNGKLEEQATAEEKLQGWDIADYLLTARM